MRITILGPYWGISLPETGWEDADLGSELPMPAVAIRQSPLKRRPRFTSSPGAEPSSESEPRAHQQRTLWRGLGKSGGPL